MKIIYIIHGTYNSAGMERVLSLKANYLAEKMGYQIIIVTTDQKGRASYYQFSEKIICFDLGIDFEDYYKYSFLRRIVSFLTKQRDCKKKLTKFLLAEKADVVVSLMSRTLSFLTEISDGSKKVYEQHFNRDFRKYVLKENKISFIGCMIYGWRGFRERHNLKKVDRFVVLTEEDANSWNNISNISIIPNALSFFPQNSVPSINKKIITVGRLEVEKGYDNLYRIWRPIAEKHPDWRLEVIGAGTEEEEIRKQLHEAGLSEVVIIRQPTPFIEKELLEASVYLMTSRHEGFPMVLIEAMACGLPVVSFRCPCGPADIIKDGEDGYLIPLGDIQHMTEKLNLLIEDEEKRRYMGKNARHNVQRFSQEVVMKQWVELFDGLINQTR